MPRITRWFIKSGMIYLFLGIVLAFLSELPFIQSGTLLLPVYWHMIVIGWITQIIMGVSIWMFPGRNRGEGFKAQKWGWFTFIFLNVGLGLRIVSEPLVVSTSAGIWNILLVGSALLQLTAGVTYLIEMWPRIMSKKQQRKKRKRQRKRSKL